MEKPPLTILLASPRGYCAGVDRAILIVEKALEKYGAPVYVRHEIVHNRFVVQELEARGAIFVDELDEVPSDMPVIFSAHGVPKAVPAEAERRKMFYLDATCPLVSKVHREAEQHAEAGRHIILIGHEGHPEVIGTVGQLPDGSMTLVQTVADAEAFSPPPGAAGKDLAYITQTTLSVDETAEIVATLQRRFPTLASPRKEDICYATTNRQHAVRAIAPRCDHVLVIGAPNSSNSLRLVEQALRAGCPAATLVQRATDIPWDELSDARTIGISAGASAPEKLVTEVIDALRERFAVAVESQSVANENITFKLPRALEA